MSSLAVACLTGRLGKDSELKSTATGKSLLKFSIAVDTGFGDSKITTWWNCTLWGKQAESLHEYLVKGKQVAVSGEPSLRKWQSEKGEGQTLELNVSSLTMIGGKADAKAEDSADESSGIPF